MPCLIPSSHHSSDLAARQCATISGLQNRSTFLTLIYEKDKKKCNLY